MDAGRRQWTPGGDDEWREGGRTRSNANCG